MGMCLLCHGPMHLDTQVGPKRLVIRWTDVPPPPEIQRKKKTGAIRNYKLATSVGDEHVYIKQK